jgi:hypothetical protein
VKDATVGLSASVLLEMESTKGLSECEKTSGIPRFRYASFSAGLSISWLCSADNNWLELPLCLTFGLDAGVGLGCAQLLYFLSKVQVLHHANTKF